MGMKKENPCDAFPSKVEHHRGSRQATNQAAGFPTQPNRCIDSREEVTMHDTTALALAYS